MRQDVTGQRRRRWTPNPTDTNDDGRINLLDAIPFVGRLNTYMGQPNYWSRLDLNVDGLVNTLDLTQMAKHWNTFCN